MDATTHGTVVRLRRSTRGPAAWVAALCPALATVGFFVAIPSHTARLIVAGLLAIIAAATVILVQRTPRIQLQVSREEVTFTGPFRTRSVTPDRLGQPAVVSVIYQGPGTQPPTALLLLPLKDGSVWKTCNLKVWPQQELDHALAAAGIATPRVDPHTYATSAELRARYPRSVIWIPKHVSLVTVAVILVTSVVITVTR